MSCLTTCYRRSACLQTRPPTTPPATSGVGLEVHEDPSVGRTGHEPLVAGDVIALEPGLWDQELGEVRLEDLLVVTDDGSETLTRYRYDLAP